MKRLLSLLLSAALLAALALPAAAEETADARLAKVTQAVKAALGLDTDAYETFYGGCSEELVPVWDLEWESGQRSLSIQALEDGTVVSFYCWEPGSNLASYRDVFPTFPENSGSDDRAIAEDFLSRVLREGETVALEQTEEGLYQGRSGSYWSGKITLNGLPSPLYWSIRVENGMVWNFSRDVPEAAAVGGVPSPSASVEQAAAAADLMEKLNLKLEYVFETPGEPKAVLRYVPEYQHEFQVDARTGELLDVTELEGKLSPGYANDSGGAAVPTAASAEGAAGGFTQAEQAGIQELEGALSREALDTALRSESAYGLRGYALASAAFERTDDGPRCTLRYGRISGEDRLYRTFYVDARTGEVLALYSTAPAGREAELTQDEAQAKAEEFLKRFCPDRSLALYSTPDYSAVPVRSRSGPSYSFQFARKENGVFFPSNLYELSIDNTDGSIYYLSITWNEDVSFEATEGLVAPEAALAAWAETYETVLAYRSIPQKLDKADPLQAQLMEQGMEYYYGLRLTYGLEREGYYSGVDAKTGRVVREDRGSGREPLAYSDLAGSSAKADIEKLAKYGVGYVSNSFRPEKNVTQWELVALLYSIQSTPLDPEAASEDERDSAYYYAYRWGVLRQADRNDGAVLTRSQLVKMLLDAAGYGPAARLGGSVFTCGYTDKGSIPAEGLGYAAIAQALGMASGAYAGTRSATRGEAASMLCRLLERPE